jgi:histidinol-phosphate aminotransferase
MIDTTNNKRETTNKKMNFNLENLVRSNIRNLVPYSSARDEFKGSAEIFLDANENSFGSPVDVAYNRYPDPLQWKVKLEIGALKSVPPENIFLGNGSDEAIDILFRAFCNPGVDNVIICPPTYGMYEVSANINDVAVQKVNLTNDFQLDTKAVLDSVNENTKLIFVCSPNNPTANLLKKEDVKLLLSQFLGLVVVDEAYIDFSAEESLLSELSMYPNLVILQTFSKAWGLAGVRAGMAFASKEIISIFNKVKPPYNVSESTQQILLKAFENSQNVKDWIALTLRERENLSTAISRLPYVEKVYPSDANFVLVKMNDPKAVYNYLTEKGIIVRDRSKVTLCEGCLRITVGTEEENGKLLEELGRF